MTLKFLTLIQEKTSIMSNKQIGLFVGSLRKESFSRKLAQIVATMAPDGFEFKMINIGQLPLYNQDFDDHNEVPESYTDYRAQVKNLDGIIFITPEYNRSLPAVLKNALDVASRPYGQNVWDGKPGAIISCSTGNISGFGANHHLRQSCTFLNIPMMQQPEAYFAHINTVFDDEGHLIDSKTNDFLQSIVDAYIKWFQYFK